MARLRGFFGDQIMIPTSRGVVPTALALDLEEPLRAALDEMRALVSRAQHFDPVAAQITFAIAASDYMQVAVLLPFLVKLNTTAPDMRLMVRLLDRRTVASDLERGEVDIAFVESGKVTAPGIRSQDVLREEYVGIARRGTIADGMPMADFLKARHIIVSPTAEGFTGPTDTALAALGLERTVGFAVASFMFLVEAVSRCDLIALAPARLAYRSVDRIDIFAPPLAVPGFDIAMIWHDRTHDHPAGQWLRREFQSFCGRD